MAWHGTLVLLSPVADKLDGSMTRDVTWRDVCMYTVPGSVYKVFNEHEEHTVAILVGGSVDDLRYLLYTYVYLLLSFFSARKKVRCDYYYYYYYCMVGYSTTEGGKRQQHPYPHHPHSSQTHEETHTKQQQYRCVLYLYLYTTTHRTLPCRKQGSGDAYSSSVGRQSPKDKISIPSLICVMSHGTHIAKRTHWVTSSSYRSHRVFWWGNGTVLLNILLHLRGFFLFPIHRVHKSTKKHTNGSKPKDYSKDSMYGFLIEISYHRKRGGHGIARIWMRVECLVMVVSFAFDYTHTNTNTNTTLLYQHQQW